MLNKYVTASKSYKCKAEKQRHEPTPSFYDPWRCTQEKHTKNMMKHGEQKQKYPNSTKSVYHPFVSICSIAACRMACLHLRETFSLLSRCYIHKQTPLKWTAAQQYCYPGTWSRTESIKRWWHSKSSGAAHDFSSLTILLIEQNRTVWEISAKIMIFIVHHFAAITHEHLLSLAYAHNYTYSHDNYT